MHVDIVVKRTKRPRYSDARNAIERLPIMVGEILTKHILPTTFLGMRNGLKAKNFRPDSLAAEIVKKPNPYRPFTTNFSREERLNIERQEMYRKAN